ncbi:MAG TPA: flagellar biosynthesis protein FlhB [Thermodesulfobium narugense]|nr:MAG: flagellar biosynthesis protein FlhB [Thermodesulfobium narugense]HEM55167.1 flagellar biosynthesis protein FlhB [Thermodesulfobium narugense]
MPFDEGDRTEPATERRRREARKMGQVAKSQELSSILVFFGSYIVLQFFLVIGFNSWFNVWKGFFSFDNFDLNLYYHNFIVAFLLLTVPPVIGALFMALFSNILQVGFVITPQVLIPKFSNLDITKYFKRLLSFRGLVDQVLKPTIKILILAYILISSLLEVSPEILNLSFIDIHKGFQIVIKIVSSILVKTMVVLFFFALIDYLFQRWQYEKSIRMSKQELKEEFKNTEGDPLIKARIKRLQGEMARRRMMQEVPKADVIITNPTHVAVAIFYDPEKFKAPKVVAKGMGIIAERIIQIAKENNVPLARNETLARALFKEVEINFEIPEKFYKAVAGILATVYKKRKKVI